MPTVALVALLVAVAANVGVLLFGVYADWKRRRRTVTIDVYADTTRVERQLHKVAASLDVIGGHRDPGPEPGGHR